MAHFRRFILSLIALFYGSAPIQSQIYDPVSWSYQVEEISASEVELQFIATIEADWHIYSLTLSSNEGPLPTSFKFNESAAYKLLGSMKEGKPKSAYDPNFLMDLTYFEKMAVFKQRVSRKVAEAFDVTGELTFMVCNEEMCLPPDYKDFKFQLKPGKAAPTEQKAKSPEKAANAETQNNAGFQPASSLVNLGESQIYIPVTWSFRVSDETDSTAFVVAEAAIEEGWHLYSSTFEPGIGPEPTQFEFAGVDSIFGLKGELEYPEPKTLFDPNFEMELPFYEGKVAFRQKIIKKSKADFEVRGFVRFMSCDDTKCTIPENVDFAFQLKGNPTYAPSDELKKTESEEERSYWGIFIVAFLSGFVALLTPCVFPMIPMTVSFFTKQSKTRAAGIRNAIIYGISIIVIYVVLGVVVTAIFGASVLSELSTDPWFNLAFFVLLVVFAISFLGAFEITLPSSWINKADRQADRGGLIGIFFMAFTLALVSFSCTGPIVGSLIVEAASKGGLAPVIGMFGFSLAIALPFALFAAFPGWMNSLPQSGGWLNSVKVFLGFLELAFAFKFLSNADMVLQWHLLEREVFLAIWIAIFGGLALYLFGKIKLPHDSELKHIGVGRLFMALLVTTFTVYLIPGLWGAPLKLISAFPPPLQYSESPMGVGFIGDGGAISEHGKEQHLGPQGIYVYHDYEKGMAAAKKSGKPAMLDFTGWACVNCRKMEQQVWSDPEIRRKLSEDVILISLYVDEKILLPKDEQITIELPGGRKRKMKYTGDKWAAMQEIKYRINAQPYYVLLDHDEEKLIEAANYQDYGKVELFDDWLRRGLKKFGK